MKAYGKFTAGLILVWFLFALGGSALHLFENNANRIGGAVAVAAATPVAIFFAWFAGSERFRQFALSLNPRILTFAQAWRVVGVVFVILAARGVLPALFALPAGYGDMAIGLTASFVALELARPGHRASFILWQALGITDLVVAVTLGTTAPVLSPGGAPMVAMTVLPLSLIPTFLVPLFLIFHAICIAQARTWKEAPDGARQAMTGAGSFGQRVSV